MDRLTYLCVLSDTLNGTEDSAIAINNSKFLEDRNNTARHTTNVHIGYSKDSLARLMLKMDAIKVRGTLLGSFLKPATF